MSGELVVRDGRIRRRLAGPHWSSVVAGLRSPWRFTRLLVDRVLRHRTLTAAAAMSYYFFFALFPLILFLVALASMLPFAGLEPWLLARIGASVPEEAQRMLANTVRGILAQPRTGLVSLGAVLALWGASSAFTAIIEGLNVAYGVEEGRTWWRVRLLAIELTLGVAGLLVLAFGGGLLAAYVVDLLAALGRPPGPVLRVLGVLVPASIATVAVGVVYYVGPDVEQNWRWVTPGSLLFTLACGGASVAFGRYVAHFGSYDRTYGALGAVIILLLWLYLLAVFLLLGGEVNATLEHMAPEGKQPGAKEEPMIPQPAAAEGPAKLRA